MRATAAVDGINYRIPFKVLKMAWITFHPKTFESKKLITHESFLIFLSVGVCSQMLPPEMWSVFCVPIAI